jgi:hypothetical protein
MIKLTQKDSGNIDLLLEIAQKSSIRGQKIKFKVRDLVENVYHLYMEKLSKVENAKWSKETVKICNDWYKFNQIIYKSQKMDGDALLSLAQVQFNEYRPIPTDGRSVEQYTRDLLIEGIKLNDHSLSDIICFGLQPTYYMDFSNLAEKASELLWKKSDKSYKEAHSILSIYNEVEDRDELLVGLSKNFVLKIIKEARQRNEGSINEKNEFENFIKSIGINR